MRLTVLLLAIGKVMVWLGVAPGTPAMVKQAAEDRSMKETSTEIPTCAVKLTCARSALGATGKYRTMETTDIPGTRKGWGMYPLLKVRTHFAGGNTITNISYSIEAG